MGMTVLMGLAAVMMLMPELALAQAGSGFDSAGQRGWQAVCSFLRSPIVTFVVAAVAIGLLIAMMSNEENKLVGRLLQILVGVAVLLALPGVLTMIGLPVPGGCG